MENTCRFFKIILYFQKIWPSESLGSRDKILGRTIVKIMTAGYNKILGFFGLCPRVFLVACGFFVLFFHATGAVLWSGDLGRGVFVKEMFSPWTMRQLART